MIYRLGRRFTFIRKWYYKLTGKYKWGYIGYIEDYGCKYNVKSGSVLYIDRRDFYPDEFDKYTKIIFDHPQKKG